MLGVLGVRMLVTFAARYSPRASEIRVDGAVLAFTFALAVIVAVILSFAPRLAKQNALGAALAAGAKRASGGLRRQRVQQTLVVAQVAVSVVLLTGAGLLTRTMQQLGEVNTGLRTDRLLTLEVPHDFNPAHNAAVIAQYEGMREKLAALPGVTQVGLGSTIPLRAAGIQLEIKAEGRAVDPREPSPQSEYRTASPEYFAASGIPLLKGKAFTTTDRANTARVVILNKTLADKLFPNQDPIGRRVAWTGDVLKFIGVSGDWRTVIGVVGNTKDGDLDAAPMPVVFEPFAQADFPSGGFVIRTGQDVGNLAPAATRIVRGIAPNQPIEKVLTLNEIRDESVAPRRLNAVLVASFGGLALIVAVIGIAAVLAFSVSARTNELGIRMSLGADSARVLRLVLAEGGLLVAIGLAIGIAGSLVLTQLMQGLLFGVAARDPVTLALVALLMAVVGIGACWIPAARASRIDPATALRAQ
jgi:putative ABC transport system permease protein